MRRLLLTAVLAAMAVAGSTALPAHASPDTQDLLWLDIHDMRHAGFAGPVTTSGPLTPARYYVAIATGTLSAYSAERWKKSPTCGAAPDPRPMWSSIGVVDAPSGADPETEWSMPRTTRFCAALPRHYASFVVDWGQGGGFIHPTANGGQQHVPRADHTYTYLLRGTGAPANFELLDDNVRDDDGMLRIVVRPAVRSECDGNAECESTAPNVPPPPLPTDGAPTTPPDGTPALPAAGGQITTGALPTSTSSTDVSKAPVVCKTKRRFRVRLTAPKGNAFRSFRVTVGGKRAKVSVHRVKHKRRTVVATVLTRVSSNAVTTVRLTVRMRHGRALRRTLHYRRCASSGLRKL
jgi:hypothetical protein